MNPKYPKSLMNPKSLDFTPGRYIEDSSREPETTYLPAVHTLHDVRVPAKSLDFKPKTCPEYVLNREKEAAAE